jgi:type II secretion system protein C
VLVACGGDPPPEPRTAAAPVTPAPPPSAEPAPAGAVRRSDVRASLKEGLGAFLQKVELDVDRPVFKDGKFFGFRILALKDASFFRGVDLRPGDVVSKVNGFPVEKPEQAIQAFQSLEVASEIRVEYERGGAPRELRVEIIEDEKKR